jgi:hypothetical protein
MGLRFGLPRKVQKLDLPKFNAVAKAKPVFRGT